MSSDASVLLAYVGLSIGSLLLVGFVSIFVAGAVFRSFSGILNADGQVATWTSSLLSSIVAAIVSAVGVAIFSTGLRFAFGIGGVLAGLLTITFAAYIVSAKLVLRYENGGQLTWTQGAAIGAATAILMLILRVIIR